MYENKPRSWWRFRKGFQIQITEGLKDCRTEGLKDWRTEGLKDWRTEGLKDWRTGWWTGPIYKQVHMFYDVQKKISSICSFLNLKIITLFDYGFWIFNWLHCSRPKSNKIQSAYDINGYLFMKKMVEKYWIE